MGDGREMRYTYRIHEVRDSHDGDKDTGEYGGRTGEEVPLAGDHHILFYVYVYVYAFAFVVCKT